MSKFVPAERFLADRTAPYCSLSVSKSFSQLRYVCCQAISLPVRLTWTPVPCSPKEKKYAHYVGEASWAGARIIQGQWTPQAQKLYDLLILTFSENGKLADLAALHQKSGVSAEEWEELLQYSSQVCVRPRLLCDVCTWSSNAHSVMSRYIL